MFKLVVLLSVAALAAAKPNVVAYNTVVPATSSVSQYSSSVVHGSPTVYGVTPGFYSAPRFYGSSFYGGVYPGFPTLSQAPNQPAVVLDPVNGVPLDTPEVVAARAAHYTAKALTPYHHLRKRSVGFAPGSYSTSVVSPVSYASYSSPLVSAYSAPWVTPYAYPSVYPKAYSVHPY